jgi:hypothetical protein
VVVQTIKVKGLNCGSVRIRGIVKKKALKKISRNDE